jgi:carbamate kinase
VLIAVALGGSALLERHATLGGDLRGARFSETTRSLAALVCDGHDLVIMHGNGGDDPLAPDADPGGAGHALGRALRDELPGREIVSVTTHTVVGAGATALGRAVPSREPRGIVELATVRRLVRTHVVTICADGGKAPVTIAGSGLRRADAVVDAELTAAVVAARLDADMLLLLTNVAVVERALGQERADAITFASPRELRALDVAPASARSTVEAACRFVEATGGVAGIGTLSDARAIVRGLRGTRVVLATSAAV